MFIYVQCTLYIQLLSTGIEEGLVWIEETGREEGIKQTERIDRRWGGWLRRRRAKRRFRIGRGKRVEGGRKWVEGSIG